MVTEVGRMAYRCPVDTYFALCELDVLDRHCPVCGRMMHICDHRYRRFHTLDGPVQLVCKLNHCPDPACPGHTKTKPTVRSYPGMILGIRVRPFHISQVVAPKVREGVSALRSTAKAARASAR